MAIEYSRREVLFGAVGGLLGLVLNGSLFSKVQAADIELQSTFLMYHQMSALQLKVDLLSYIRQGYQPISLETLIGYFNQEVEIPLGLPTFLVTCDDGLASQYKAVMSAVDDVRRQTEWFVPVNFFVLTKFDDPRGPLEEVPDDTPSYSDGVHQYMTKGQLIELIQAGYRVENHTVNHPDLTRLDVNNRNADVEGGEARIKTLWKLAGRERKYRAFAYPYGRYQGQEDYIGGLYDVAFSTMNTVSHSQQTRWRLGRARRS